MAELSLEPKHPQITKLLVFIILYSIHWGPVAGMLRSVSFWSSVNLCNGRKMTSPCLTVITSYVGIKKYHRMIINWEVEWVGRDPTLPVHVLNLK